MEKTEPKFNSQVIPEKTGGWNLDKEKSRPEENFYLYRNGKFMCGVSKKEAHWEKHYGAISPAGINIVLEKSKTQFSTLEEALNPASWWNPKGN